MAPLLPPQPRAGQGSCGPRAVHVQRDFPFRSFHPSVRQSGPPHVSLRSLSNRQPTCKRLAARTANLGASGLPRGSALAPVGWEHRMARAVCGCRIWQVELDGAGGVAVRGWGGGWVSRPWGLDRIPRPAPSTPPQSSRPRSLPARTLYGPAAVHPLRTAPERRALWRGSTDLRARWTLRALGGPAPHARDRRRIRDTNTCMHTYTLPELVCARRTLARRLCCCCHPVRRGRPAQRWCMEEFTWAVRCVQE